MNIKFNEIKQTANNLLLAFNSLPKQTGEEEILTDLYSEDVVKEKQDLIDFYLSFREEKEFMRSEYDLDDPSFNELSGFTIEYRTICFDL